MHLPGLADRFLRTRAFRISAAIGAAVFTLSALLVTACCFHYSRVIDARLNGRLFEHPPRVFDHTGKPVASLYTEGLVKRRLVKFEDIPPVLTKAVLAGEDQNFFEHHGLDFPRIAAALLWDVREGDRLQGASTITQQLARSLFLTNRRTLRRKISEAFIAVLLELRLTKKQIFTMYANEIYLGEHGLYAVHGFGQAAQSLFGKNMRDLTLAEAATLAGIIPAPNQFSPARHPDRAIARRNLILKTMRESGTITDADYRAARTAKLKVIHSVDDNEAAYFLDSTRDELFRDYPKDAVRYGGYRVYTTLDVKLQKAADEAVAKGLALVEKQLGANKVAVTNAGRPEAALIALDPHTGEIKAIVGGRDYSASQYNRATQAFRQPGSAFKPFVYAAALETAFDVKPAGAAAQGLGAAAGNDSDNPSIQTRIITPVTQIMDAPKGFAFAGAVYEPNNFKGSYAGLVTIRTALEESLNSVAVQVAEWIGYGRVATFAHRLGLNNRIQGYPSIALGAFEVTPMELAGAYTAFANGGRWVQPHVLRRVETGAGADVTKTQPAPRAVVRPELAYVMTNLMEGVINHGTGAAVRARGFGLPAAGKTGTSRDGWFVGYTKDLLVVAWVGFDDNRDLGLEGSRSALPIWTDFMMKAYALDPPDKHMEFPTPPGVEFVTIDAESLKRATPECTDTFQEVFIRGTAPAGYCPAHSVADAAEPASTAGPNAVSATSSGH